MLYYAVTVTAFLHAYNNINSCRESLISFIISPEESKQEETNNKEDKSQQKSFILLIQF